MFKMTGYNVLLINGAVNVLNYFNKDIAHACSIFEVEVLLPFYLFLFLFILYLKLGLQFSHKITWTIHADQ